MNRSTRQFADFSIVRNRVLAAGWYWHTALDRIPVLPS
jgi:hypothetical protein